MRSSLLVVVVFFFCACNSENVKPKELKGDWTFVSGRYANLCVGGETPYIGPGSCKNQSGLIAFHMKFTKTDMTRIDNTNPNNTITVPYTVKGKVITGTYKNGHKFTLTVKELTENRLSWRQADIDGAYNYTMDMDFKR